MDSDNPQRCEASAMLSIGTRTTMQSSSVFTYQESDSFISASTYLKYVKDIQEKPRKYLSKRQNYYQAHGRKLWSRLKFLDLQESQEIEG